MATEIWKPVRDYEFYEISNLGRVKSLSRTITRKDGYTTSLKEHILRPPVGRNGYRMVALPGGAKQYVHRMVAQAFLESLEDTHYVTVNHKDGNKLNNAVENLEWATYKQNNVHARNAGLCNQHGENTNLARWSDQCVEAVRRLHATGKLKQIEIAQCLGVSRTFVSQIILGQTRTRPTK